MFMRRGRPSSTTAQRTSRDERARGGVLDGRCPVCAARLANGAVRGERLHCSCCHAIHRLPGGRRGPSTERPLHRFTAWIDLAFDAVFIDAAEVRAQAARLGGLAGR